MRITPCRFPGSTAASQECLDWNWGDPAQTNDSASSCVLCAREASRNWAGSIEQAAGDTKRGWFRVENKSAQATLTAFVFGALRPPVSLFRTPRLSGLSQDLKILSLLHFAGEDSTSMRIPWPNARRVRSGWTYALLLCTLTRCKRMVAAVSGGERFGYRSNRQQ